MKVTRPKKAGKPVNGRLSLLAAGVGLPHPDKVRRLRLSCCDCTTALLLGRRPLSSVRG
jgi:hypothetical protein